MERRRSPLSGTPTTSDRTTTTRSSPNGARARWRNTSSPSASPPCGSPRAARAKASRWRATVRKAAGRPTAAWRSTSNRSFRADAAMGEKKQAEKKVQGFARGLTNYGDAGFSLYLRRSFAKSMGYSKEMLARPVVGIADSRSGFNNCHRHFPELIDAVKRGVLAAGGLPIVFPTISLGEVFLNPTRSAGTDRK